VNDRSLTPHFSLLHSAEAPAAAGRARLGATLSITFVFLGHSFPPKSPPETKKNNGPQK
jgi:hypothetical protein